MLADSRVAEPDWHYCQEVARVHGRTFYFASRLLPAHRRRAILAAYAFARTADDLVDRATADGLGAAATALDAWEAEIETPRHPIAVAFAVAREQYGIPTGPVFDLIEGVRRDLTPHRYSTWEDLRDYCYLVAGTIGLIAAPILGCRDDEALPHAVNLGIAMQLTNILRDIAEDARLGRLYLPLDDLARFDVCPETLLSGRPSGRLAEMLAFQIARARDLYHDARLGIPALTPAGQITTLASSHLYAKILTRIEEQRYDVFGPRAYIPTRRKVGAMPAIAASFVRLYV